MHVIAEYVHEEEIINGMKHVHNYKPSKPIELFETTAKETEKILKETADFIDVQVKNFENKEKEEKLESIREIFNQLVEELKDILTLEKIFDIKWLNKTVKLPTIEEEIKDKLDGIRQGLKAIEELHSEFELEVKNTFIEEHFDLSKAIFKNTQLAEQKKALAKVEEKKEEIVQEKVETMLKEEVKEDVSDPMMTYTLKITAPLSKQKALKVFLDLNNMDYKKVD